MQPSPWFNSGTASPPHKDTPAYLSLTKVSGNHESTCSMNLSILGISYRWNCMTFWPFVSNSFHLAWFIRGIAHCSMYFFIRLMFCHMGTPLPVTHSYVNLHWSFVHSGYYVWCWHDPSYRNFSADTCFNILVIYLAMKSVVSYSKSVFDCELPDCFPAAAPFYIPTWIWWV